MVHQYKLNGYNIVLDVGSGSVHTVDDVAYDAIALYETTSREELAALLVEKYGAAASLTLNDTYETLDDIAALKQAGKLYAPDRFEPVSLNLKAKKSVVKALCLHVSHACNLTCEYCFAGEGRYHGEAALMSLETGCRAIDFLIENSGTRKNLEVDFFGGEPLLNWEVCKGVVRYARQREKECGKRFRFTLTTNGVLIDDDVIDFSNREMHNVVLGLDGRQKTHDRMRKTPDGGGSYELILPKFRRLVEKRGHKGYYIRGTFTRNNLEFTDDILHMADLGFTELSMEPVVSAPDMPYALRETDLPQLFVQYEKLASEMLLRQKEGRGFTFYHFMIDLTGGPCVYKRIAGCGSGTEYLAVTPSGDLYPCHQFVGESDYRMGSIWEGVTNDAKRAEFAAVNAYSRPECRAGWARLYCSVGCPANAYHASGPVDGLYEFGCSLFKKRMECAIMLKVAEAVDKVEP
jgi:uncharacterized protein